MKYLIINGSPHKGNTWTLAELVKDELLALSDTAVFDEIHLADLNLSFCCGCSVCFRKGHAYCPHSIIVSKLIDAIHNADGVIFVTTTFFFRETALMKNFMDHLCFMAHRPQFFRSKALVISTATVAGAKMAAKSVASFLGAIGFNRSFLLTASSFSWNDYRPNERIRGKCASLALKFHRAVSLEKLKSPAWGLLIPYNLFRGLFPAYRNGTKYETEDGVYWTEPQRARNVYDVSVPVPIYKRLFGGLFYGVGRLTGKLVTITYTP